MTPEMLALARKNAAKFSAATGLANVEFRQGQIENLPVDDASVDVVISNCVINLSPDKPRVFREVYRVLQARRADDRQRHRAEPPAAEGAAGQRRPLRRLHRRGGPAGAIPAPIRDAGLGRVDVLAQHSYRAADAGNDPITSKAGGSLEGIASSITVLATK